MLNQTIINSQNREIIVYNTSDNNIDFKTVESFGHEWTGFNTFSETEIKLLGSEYFDIVTEEMVNSSSIIADFGCGSGRFSKYWQGKVKKIYAIDPSDAVFAADAMLGKDENVKIIKASISDLPFSDNFFDFGMSIGVLHHIPDTQKAMEDCVKKIKSGGYFYTYLYYSLDNRSLSFRIIWHLSNSIRRVISALPQKIKKIACELLAVILYMPFVLFTKALKKMGFSETIWKQVPLSAYHNKSFFVIRNDSLDRFGTPLEHRFSKLEIIAMMEKSGLSEINVSPNIPYWHAVGKKI